jgi:hypothetical protein
MLKREMRVAFSRKAQPIWFRVVKWKTKGWTQPWGGWNDLDAGRD